MPTLKDKIFLAQHVFDEELLLAVPCEHELTSKEQLTYEDLKNQTLILLEDGHCLRDQAIEICLKAQASELNNFRAISLETLRYMVSSGVGITLMPTLSTHLNDGVCYFPFHPAPMRSIGLISRQTTAKKILLEFLSFHIKNMVEVQAVYSKKVVHV